MSGDYENPPEFCLDCEMPVAHRSGCPVPGLGPVKPMTLPSWDELNRTQANEVMG